MDEAPIDVIAKEIIGFTLEQGQTDLNIIYDIFSQSPIFKMDNNKFKELINYMEQNGVIKNDEGVISPGNTFYKIWKFKSKDQVKVWWSRSFSEFFTTIPEKDVFVVKSGDNTIGYIDSLYVYRNLRVGDVIRLAGSSWEIKRIDDMNGRVDVMKATGIAEIPLWKGEGVKRNQNISRQFIKIIVGDIPNDIVIDKTGLVELEKIREK